jgi:hypothetical protein
MLFVSSEKQILIKFGIRESTYMKCKENFIFANADIGQIV